MKKSLILILAVLLFVSGCDKGIAPPAAEEQQQQAGFEGTITFKGAWPEGVTRTHLVVFENSLLSPQDFNILNLKFISKAIPYGVEEFNYSSLDSAVIPISSGKFSYVAVAQSKSENLSLNRSDWYVIGVYYTGGDSAKPAILTIPDKTLIKDINITCDFNNPPPQPPGG